MANEKRMATVDASNNIIDIVMVASDYTLGNNEIFLTIDTTQHDEDMARMRRDDMLKGTDFMMSSDYPITSAQRTELETYRQALRDVTTHANWPDGFEEPTNDNTTYWPDEPSFF